jgi:UDP-4-amino-4,6-dideoxy-N-acetyl-beta-L-altrosamine transaminase
MAMIPYGRQSIDETDIDAVIEVLKSDFLTQGPAVPAFEKALSEYCGAPYAVAVNSATSALHLACLALDVGPGDVVWTSPISFVASANCALYCGATVDFVDIDSRTYNISIEKLKDKLTLAEQCGVLPKVLIPVHLCGQSCDMESIRALSSRFGFKVIEDASHAIGATYKNHPVGSCEYSDITVFSFHPVKIITTGEGGAALTKNAALADRMRSLRSHGITRNASEMDREPDGPWYYQQVELGFNYRITEMQAALGYSQLRRLDDFVAVRNVLAQRYDKTLVGLPITSPWRHPDNYSAFHLYVIRLQEKEASRRKEIFLGLRSAGIGVNVHYIPIYDQPFYRNLGIQFERCEEADRYYESAITLPLYPELSEEKQERVIAVLTQLVT